MGGIVANNTYRADFISENLRIQQNVIEQSFKTGVKKNYFFWEAPAFTQKMRHNQLKKEYLLTGPLNILMNGMPLPRLPGLKCVKVTICNMEPTFWVMPTNLYGPNDNFDLQKSHVLPSPHQKILFGKMSWREWLWKNSVRPEIRPLQAQLHQKQGCS